MHTQKNNPFIEYGKIPEKTFSEVFTTSSLYITMRDGVKIAATICLPKELSKNDKIPTLLVQTRYWRAYNLRIPFRWVLNEVLYLESTPTPEIFTSHGYAVVFIDVRGTGASFGTRLIPWTDDEIKDGSDIVDWIVARPWSDGNVVSNGISYPGTCAEKLGINNHPAIKAIMPGHVFWDVYTDVVFPGGCYDLQFMKLWSFLGKNLDQNNPKMLREFEPASWLLMKGVKAVDSDKNFSLLKEAINQHSSNRYVHDIIHETNFRDDLSLFDDISTYSRKEDLERSNIPILGWSSWLDSGYGDAVIYRFQNLKNPQIGILGDWNHGAAFPANPFFPKRKIVSPTPKERVRAWLNFFDKCVKGEGIQGKTLYYYTMVEEKWKKTNFWPPEGLKMQRWYFAENNGLITTIPQEESGFDKYKINFSATTGQNNRWWALLGVPIIYDNRTEMDEKLLTYTSNPLEKEVEITGQPIINLYLSSTHQDGAIFVYLEDVDESGNVTYITDGQIRLIHRKISSEEPPYKSLIPYHTYNKKDAKPLIPGEITEVKFGLHVTSVLIRKGHKIRIAIAGCDKDTFTRYPSEGSPIITVFRNNIHASYINIPIIQRKMN